MAIMGADSFLYLDRKDVQAVDLSMPEIIDAIEAAFRDKGEGRVEMPPKLSINPRADAFMHAMPAWLPGLRSAGMKWVAGYPDNPGRGLPYISGLLILNDPDTGIPVAVMDATWITAQRTGAATALAAKYLARADSSSAGILGCGVQGRSNLLALSLVFGIERVRAFDIRAQAAAKFADEMEKRLQIEIEVVDDPRKAVIGLDLVVTGGPIRKNPEPVIEAGWLAEGAFACPVDFDSYWTGDAFRQADKLATDDLEQLEYYRGLGYFRDTPRPGADLGEIVTGRKPGREHDGERAICINLGLALEDIATAEVIYERAQRDGLGTRLPL